MRKPNRKLLNVWLFVHALVTLAAGIVLVAAPESIPSTVGVTLSGKAQLLAFFLGAAEISIAFLSFGARRIQDFRALSLVIWTFIVFHLATAVVELYDMMLHGFSPVLWANIAVRVAVVAFFVYLRSRLK